MNGSAPQAATHAGAAPAELDDATQWLEPLRASGPDHDRAVRALHELLTRASHFEVHRRAAAMGVTGDPELEDVAVQCAGDSLVAVLARLDSFEGRSRFTTWAYKFAIHTAGVAVRRHVWRDRAMHAPDHDLRTIVDRASDPSVQVEDRELLQAIVAGIHQLTPHQRTVLLTLAVDGVPIDVLAERLTTNRNALYKTLHDARRRLRRLVEESGVTP